MFHSKNDTVTIIVIDKGSLDTEDRYCEFDNLLYSFGFLFIFIIIGLYYPIYI